MTKVSTHEAKTHLSRLLARVARGEEFLICNRDVPKARLVAAKGTERSVGRPKVGTLTSAPVWIAKDAFAPLSTAELADWGL